MATISIKQNMKITDPKKAKEVLTELEMSQSNFEEVKPAERKDKTKEVAKIWFKR